MENTYTQQAIKMAVEGGYDAGLHITSSTPHEFKEWEILSDPKFWQALGKKLGWATTKEKNDYKPHRIGLHSDDNTQGDCYCNQPKDYISYWHCFIDHLAAEKPAEEFFRELLK